MIGIHEALTVIKKAHLARDGVFTGQNLVESKLAAFIGGRAVVEKEGQPCIGICFLGAGD